MPEWSASGTLQQALLRKFVAVDSQEDGSYHGTSRETMISRGWCVHHVNYLEAMLRPVAFQYVSGLERTSLRQEDHSACVKQPWCIAFNVNLKSYTAKHVTDLCSCEEMGIDENELVQIISQRMGVPLISIKDTADGGLALHLEERGRNSKYVAVSHVWADGLGNPNRNGLPKCQLKRLKDILKVLAGKLEENRAEPLFWIDTLCIPVDVARGQLRMKSINRMDSIYAEAEAVLALDAELMATDSRSIENCLARVVTSAWMGRSWTCQEAILAKRIFFQFARELQSVYLIAPNFKHKERRSPFYPRRLVWTSASEDCRRALIKGFLGMTDQNFRWKWVFEATDWVVSQTGCPPTIDDARQSCYTGIGQFWEDRSAHRVLEAWRLHPQSSVQQAFEHFLLHGFFEVKQSWSSMDDRFVIAWNALAGRSSTNEDDKVIILATLMGIDRRDLLLDSIPDTRLRKLIFSLYKIPLALLFVKGKKLYSGSQSPLRWVPVTIGNETIGSYPTLRVQGRYMSCEYGPEERNADRIMVLIVDSVISKSFSEIQLAVAGDMSIRLSTHVQIDDSIRIDSFYYTCFIIELSQGNKRKRGAMLYGTTMTRKEKLYLFYHCPVQVEEIRQPFVHTQDDQAHPTRVMTEDAELCILCDPLPTQQSLTKVPDHSMWIRFERSINVWELADLSFHLSCISCFGIYLLGYHDRFDSRPKLSLIVLSGPLIVLTGLGSSYLFQWWRVLRNNGNSYERE
ncbi:hypothetical protein K461DRAFT_278415 [Myriangium duriaei CBS 260.36]|uniref:Heterokaryon incompatibility domain-containing protein n=1 Tax=Myriangium duriaei CBS 260.36 TaxID=1168546 RepID=A0A9P4MND6_9PEZI|nr:hypothetical protein K461DRAFT_278415 [Myriangium duriaei CBS 260.36]